MKLQRFNENINTSIKDGDYFIEEGHHNKNYFQLSYDPEDRGKQFDIWTPKGNVNIIVFNKDEFEGNSEDDNYIRLGSSEEDVKKHFLALFEDDNEDLQNRINGILKTPGEIHLVMVETLKMWLTHYTNEGVLNQIMDKHLPIDSISDQEMIKDKDIQLAIRLLRRM